MVYSLTLVRNPIPTENTTFSNSLKSCSEPNVCLCKHQDCHFGWGYNSSGISNYFCYKKTNGLVQRARKTKTRGLEGILGEGGTPWTSSCSTFFSFLLIYIPYILWPKLMGRGSGGIWNNLKHAPATSLQKNRPEAWQEICSVSC